VCELADIRLRGAHNLLNVLAACAIAGAAGAPADAMRVAISSFQGVPHRLELVREWNGVQFVNDSIATSPERSMAALRSFDEPIILLAGGRDKHLPWEEWADLVLRKARGVILFGEAAGLIERALQRAFERAAESGCRCRLSPENVRPAVTLERAVQIASEMAEPGDVVLLSPGGTSYDAYTDFVERGEHFRKLVKML
jgi:UDP-N-acetylmuramoylalanine--D-glutamate ligase